MKHTYIPRGVCSRKIELELDETGKIVSVRFEGGCSGNTQGVSALVVGMTAKEAIERLGGIRCGPRATSCPDQLSIALTQALEKLAAHV